MDATWILRKLGKDAIGKRIEIQLASDGKWWAPSYLNFYLFCLLARLNILSFLSNYCWSYSFCISTESLAIWNGFSLCGITNSSSPLTILPCLLSTQ
jgi:hypothetical protein